jgi:hypothetical protein
MKKLVYIVLMAMVTLILASMGQAASPHQATGGGYLDVDDAGVFAKATLAITAKQVDPVSCEASGRILAVDHAEGGRVTVEVLHMVVDGNNAWIGGVVTQSTNPNDVGDEYVWQVQDNGEAVNATGPDMLGIRYMPAEDACEMPSMFVWLPWTHGNVMVK